MQRIILFSTLVLIINLLQASAPAAAATAVKFTDPKQTMIGKYFYKWQIAAEKLKIRKLQAELDSVKAQLAKAEAHIAAEDDEHTVMYIHLSNSNKN